MSHFLGESVQASHICSPLYPFPIVFILDYFSGLSWSNWMELKHRWHAWPIKLLQKCSDKGDYFDILKEEPARAYLFFKTILFCLSCCGCLGTYSNRHQHNSPPNPHYCGVTQLACLVMEQKRRSLKKGAQLLISVANRENGSCCLRRYHKVGAITFTAKFHKVHSPEFLLASASDMWYIWSV